MIKTITTKDWEKVNQIVLEINRENDSRKMRKSFLQNLRILVLYDIGEFSLGNEDYNFFDSVEVNMADGKEVDILKKYYEYKDAYGYENNDWIFRYPNSIVVRERDIIEGEGFEESKLNSLFLPSLNMKYFCTVSLAFEKTFLGELTIYRQDFYGGFSDKDVFILDILKDHLANRLYKDIERNCIKLTKDQIQILNERKLTKREIEIFELTFFGYSNKQISEKLFISEHTVKKHMGNIFLKLNINNRDELRNSLRNAAALAEMSTK